MSGQKAKREVKKTAYGPRKGAESLFIIAEVLEATRAGALNSQIMDKAKLSSSRLDACLKFLFKAKLVEVIARNEKTLYKTTTQGDSRVRS